MASFRFPQGAVLTLIASLILTTTASADSALDSLKSGNAELKSAGALAFGPEGVLFVGDAAGSAIVALDTQDRPKTRSASALKIDGVDGKIAGLLGATAKDITVNDLIVNPLSGNAYASVTRGKGADAKPAIVRLDPQGSVEELELGEIKFAKYSLGDLSNRRQEAITDLAFVDGRVFIAGLSNEEFASRFRAVAFPFADSKDGKGTSIEIFHGAHGALETRSPVRTFTTFAIQGQPCLLAAYTCTPLVKIPLADLKPGAHVKGVTIAELGNRNKPLDLIAYSKDGKEYLLIANSSRGVMKVKTDGIANAESISKRVANTAGLPYSTIAELKGVEQLDKLDDQRAIVLVRDQDGALNLSTVDLP